MDEKTKRSSAISAASWGSAAALGSLAASAGLDPVAAAGLSSAFAALIDTVARAFADGPDVALAVSFEKQRDDILKEVHAGLKALEARTGLALNELAAKVDAREAEILFLRLLREASRSATHERMGLMARSIAGIFEPDLDSEMKSRAERALEQLEPSDIVALRHLLDGTAEEYSLTPSTAGALLASGCVIPGGRWGSVVKARPTRQLVSIDEVTQTADAIVRFVAQWPGAAQEEAPEPTTK